MYRDGNGVDRNYQKCLEYFFPLARKGNSDAQLAIGNLYDRGVGLPQNLARAFEYYMMSAESGNSAAQFNLGSLFPRGCPENEFLMRN